MQRFNAKTWPMLHKPGGIHKDYVFFGMPNLTSGDLSLLNHDFLHLSLVAITHNMDDIHSFPIKTILQC